MRLTLIWVYYYVICVLVLGGNAKVVVAVLVLKEVAKEQLNLI